MTSDLAFDVMTAKAHPGRWQLHRAGIVNVWFYYDATFQFSGGRCIWRGTNGAGKSRALELLLPFLLDADRRRMDATGQGRVRLEELMRAGGNGEGNRLGYLWLELERHTEDGPQYLTLGALVRFSHSTAKADAWYFTTPLRVGTDLPLLGPGREPLPRAGLTELIGTDRITDSPSTHRDRVRTEVFGLHGDNGAQRFTGLMQLLHTLRAPDVGNKIDDGNLTKILAEAMPPLSETTLADAGSKLDALRETREAQQRLATSRDSVQDFVDVYSKYASATLRGSVSAVSDAASAADKAQEEAGAAVDLSTRAREEEETARRRLQGLDEQVTTFGATVDAIRMSDRYSQVEDLAAREDAADAVRGAADGAWRAVGTSATAAARAAKAASGQAATLRSAVTRAGAKAGEVDADMERSGLQHQLPATWDVSIERAPARHESWHETAAAAAEQHTLPAADLVRVRPDDLLAAATATTRAREAAAARGDVAEHRASVARHLDVRHQQIATKERAVENQESAASTAAQDADTKSEERDRAAVALAQAWATWVNDPQTQELLAPAQWPAAAVGVLQDANALTGDVDDGDLTALREVPAAVSREPLEALAESTAELRTRDREERTCLRDLEDEDRQLRDQRDPAPPTGPGNSRPVPGAVPLWQAVEFTTNVPSDVQAGVEAALLASGLLTASLSASGAHRASDGQVILAASGPVAPSNVGSVLRPDPASALPPAVTQAVLDRIGWDDLTHPVAVTAAGQWRNGHLHGAHTSPAAVHIGAAARAAARAARLAAIAHELADLEAARVARQEELERLKRTADRVYAHLRTAPAGDTLIRLRSSARTLQHAAATLASQAREARKVVDAERQTWTVEHLEHARACANQNLAPDVAALQALAQSCAAAVRGCDALVGLISAAAEAAEEHIRRSELVDDARTALDDELTLARSRHSKWVQVATELSTLRATIGSDREQVLAELEQASSQLTQASGDQMALRSRLQDTLIGQHAEAQALVKETEGALGRAVELMRERVRHLRAQVSLRGVLPAAIGERDLQVPAEDAAPAEVARACRAALATLPAVTVSARQIDAAIQTLSTRLTGVFDVTWNLEHDMRIVTLTDVNGSWPATTALARLYATLQDGQAALNEQERRVFTTFVLQGVAGELGARIRQARTLVQDMNDSLQHIRTQQGIRLSVAWALPPDSAPEIHELTDLAMGGYETRSEADDARLVTLIKSLVDQAADLDPSAGYTAHLQAALDYRQWHKMSVFILGSGTRERRPITPRSKLSQGETRFVSYATLFAAVDAFLTGLPDTGLALRLVLLDDAFAKIDNVVVAQFLGLLVSLDLDFAMTGHGLWGTVPQVPALDVYEVRRNNGPAVTTHVHWDGHTRHLQPVPAAAGAL